MFGLSPKGPVEPCDERSGGALFDWEFFEPLGGKTSCARSHVLVEPLNQGGYEETIEDSDAFGENPRNRNVRTRTWVDRLHLQVFSHPRT